MKVRSIRIVSLAVLVGAVLTSIAPAHAASLRSTASGLRYDAAAGEANVLEATVTGRVLHLTDTGAASFSRPLPTSCIQIEVATGVAADCTAPGGQRLQVDLGDGDDRLIGYDLPGRISLTVAGGSGTNVVEGGAGDDRIIGGDERDTLYGGGGSDFIDGGGGNDYVRGNGGNDEVRGGNDGIDNINFILGDGGNDTLVGGSSIDYLTGGGGDDTISAGDGSDDIGAGSGNDVIRGGGGDDELRGGAGTDSFFGGAGDDLLRARDGEGDRLDCGAGAADIARVDAGEVDEARRSCETVRQADAAVTEPADVDSIG